MCCYLLLAFCVNYFADTYVWEQAATDQATLDIMLPIIFQATLALCFTALGILVVVCQVTWQILILLVPLFYVYYWYQVSRKGCIIFSKQPTHI